MLRTATSTPIRLKSAGFGVHNFRFCNHLYPQLRIQRFSTNKSLLDDSEEIDPELVEEPYTSQTPINGHFPNQSPHESAMSARQQYAQQSMQSIMNDIHMQQQQSPIGTRVLRNKPKVSTAEIQERQKKTWTSISNTLQGIWECMESIDKTNIKRIDKVYQKLMKLEELHVKNIQHSLHHIAMLRDEVATVNGRINHVFQRLSDLEQTSPSEWLEWSIPKFEIPFEDGVYLRSPGYEVGSMIWCIELRWEMDELAPEINEREAEMETFDENGEADNETDENKPNPIIDFRDDTEGESDGEGTEHTDDDEDGSQQQRVKKGYRRLGVYVSPRSVANWERLSSLKATCEVRINENDYSETMNLLNEKKKNTEKYQPDDNQHEEEEEDITPPNKSKKKQQHFSVSGEFLRGKKLTSWGRTLPHGEEFFDGNKLNDEISIKLRIVNQTLTYQQYADEQDKNNIVSGSTNISESDIQTESIKPKFENFDFKDKGSGMLKQQKQSDMKADIEEQVQRYMSIPMAEFWQMFSEQVESGKTKEGVSVPALAKTCKLDLNLVGMFRKGPMAVSEEQEDVKENKEDHDEQERLKSLNSTQRARRKKRMLDQKVRHAKQWQKIVEYDLKHPEFRRELATFLVKHKHKRNRNLQSKAGF